MLPDAPQGFQHGSEEKDPSAKKQGSANSISILFTGHINFTANSEQQNAPQTAEERNSYYSAFDQMIKNHRLEKLKATGNGYLCAASDKAVTVVIKTALEISQFISVSNKERRKHKLPLVECSISLHIIPVTDNDDSYKMHVDDIWKDIVNIALQLQTANGHKQITLAGSIPASVKQEYNCICHDAIEIKNNGFIDVCLLNAKDHFPIYSITGAENFILGKLKRNLPPQLTYHGFHHTEDVLNAVLKIAAAENIDEAEVQLLRIAALFHDSGFTELYKNHEEKGCAIAREYLPLFGFSETDIDCISGMIMATKIPQRPQTKLQEIICDADLDYLGRDDFFTIGKTLFEELVTYSIIKNEQQWNTMQVEFLGSHHYFTNYSIREREPQKQQYLAALKKELDH